MTKKLSDCQILVMGDVMLDRYLHGNTNRISPEAPVPVVLQQQEFNYPGGAGNVALNIASLKGQATLIGLTGLDDSAKILEELLEAQHVHCEFQKLKSIPTITKTRIFSQNQQILRLDAEEALFDLDKSPLESAFDTRLTQNDLVILSDYGKGTLSDVQTLIQKAKAQQCQVLIDPKGTDFDRYQGADFITPNLKEFTAVVGACPDEDTLISKAESLIKKLNIKGLLVTRGADGMTCISQNTPAFTIPTVAKEVFDVTGAGDTVISVFAMALATQHDLQSAVQLANTAAGVVVGHIGAATITTDELYAALHQASDLPTGVVNSKTLKKAIEQAHLMNEKVIFTNGCFDILHQGHILYLEEAKQLGDRLIVAVNVDETIVQLKGSERPIIPLQDRMANLAALRCVDWVIPFSEMTPTSLIKELKPDVLAKGGDYSKTEIVGYEVVEEYGGEVRPMALKPGTSTTQIIKKIRQ